MIGLVKGFLMSDEFYGRSIIKAGMRPDGVVGAAPVFDDHARLATREEPLQAQAFVAQLSVEALVGAFLPGLARIDLIYCPLAQASNPKS